MAKVVTTEDVARAAGVSIVTVSRVLNNHTNVTDTVRQRVLHAARELGYAGRRAKAAASWGVAAAGRPSVPLKDVGFLFDTHVDNDVAASNPFWSYILAGVENETRRLAIKMSYRAIAGLSDSPRALLTTLRDMQLDGILLVGTATEKVVRLIHSTGLPLVLVDNHVPACAVDSVLSDNTEGARAAVAHLIGLGHRRIAFIGGPTTFAIAPINTVYTVEQRVIGYWTALHEAGLPIDDQLFVTCNMTTAGAYAACQQLLARDIPFSAVICANDESAIGTMKALSAAGRRVPDDISVVGFDDIDMAEHLTPALTTVRIHKRAIGVMAVKALLARAQDPEALPITILLPTELIVRGSTGIAPDL